MIRKVIIALLTLGAVGISVTLGCQQTGTECTVAQASSLQTPIRLADRAVAQASSLPTPCCRHTGITFRQRQPTGL